MTEAVPAHAAPAGTHRFVALGLLFLVYAFNFIDRQILGILVPAIKADLHFTDTELGWLGGPAFAIFYTALGVPIAWLADRSSRTWIMTIALVVWSGFTAACGYAGNFAQLFLARLGVGVGEAGGVAPAYSLISDYFPPRERARALAVYSFGIPIGIADAPQPAQPGSLLRSRTSTPRLMRPRTSSGVRSPPCTSTKLAALFQCVSPRRVSAS